jgi:hypothetical protein
LTLHCVPCPHASSVHSDSPTQNSRSRFLGHCSHHPVKAGKVCSKTAFGKTLSKSSVISPTRSSHIPSTPPTPLAPTSTVTPQNSLSPSDSYQPTHPHLQWMKIASLRLDISHSWVLGFCCSGGAEPNLFPLTRSCTVMPNCPHIYLPNVKHSQHLPHTFPMPPPSALVHCVTLFHTHPIENEVGGVEEPRPREGFRACS